MQLIVTDRVAWSVCLSVTLLSTAKTAELIEVPLGLRTQVGPWNHVLDGGPDTPSEGAILAEESIESIGTFQHELCNNGSTD